MSDKIYNALSFIGRILFPALSTLILSMGDIWCIPFVKEISTTIVAIATFLNALLAVESKKYFDNLNK